MHLEQLSRNVASPKVTVGRLRQWMPEGVRTVLAQLGADGSRGVLVGGAVRDAFLGMRAQDWDVATDAPPGKVARLFDRVMRAGERFGTVMVLLDDGPVEVTTFRSEGPYLDGRRPSRVDFHDNLEADLARRDFTVNAMACDPTAGVVIDPFGGAADLAQGRIRCVGDPQTRFAEDGLRPLRAIRFAAVLGFAVDPKTEQALANSLSSFRRVAWERRRDELEALLARGRCLEQPLALLETSGLLGVLAPELTPLAQAAAQALQRLGVGHPYQRLALWFQAQPLRDEVAQRVLRRWRMARRHQRAVLAWMHAARLTPQPPAPGAATRRWIAAAGRAWAADAARILAAWDSKSWGGWPQRVSDALDSGACLALRDLAVGGNELVEMGIRGPAVGRVLDHLLEAVLDDPTRNRADTLRAIAHTLSTSESPNGPC